MAARDTRLAALKLLISGRELSNQQEVLKALISNGYVVTQATLSRDLKQLKVAKAASMSGKYVYVLPNETMYKRVTKPSVIAEMQNEPSSVSVNFSGSMAVIKTRPGYASAIAYDIDNSNLPEILGTIAGDDTIFIMLREGTYKEKLKEALGSVVANMR